MASPLSRLATKQLCVYLVFQSGELVRRVPAWMAFWNGKSLTRLQGKPKESDLNVVVVFKELFKKRLKLPPRIVFKFSYKLK